MRPFNCVKDKNNITTSSDYITLLNKKNKCLPICLADPNAPISAKNCICPIADEVPLPVTKIDYIPTIPCMVPFNNNNQTVFKTNLIPRNNCIQCCGGGGGGGGGGGVIPFIKSIITTNNIPVVFFATPIELDKIVTVHGTVQARGTTGGISAQFTGSAVNTGGICDLVGEPVILYNTTSPDVLVDMDIFGCDLNVIVQGPAADSYKWVAVYFVLYSTPP